MRHDRPLHTACDTPLTLGVARVGAWHGAGYWYWFSVGAPDG